MMMADMTVDKMTSVTICSKPFVICGINTSPITCTCTVSLILPLSALKINQNVMPNGKIMKV